MPEFDPTSYAKASRNSRDLNEIATQIDELNNSGVDTTARANLAKITSLPDGVKHRALIIFTTHGSYEYQPTETLRNQGFGVMATSAEYFAEHAEDLAKDFDVLVITQGKTLDDRIWAIDHISRITAQQLADALLWWKNNGKKIIYTFDNGNGRAIVRKYNADGTAIETVDITSTLFETTIIESTIPVGTGVFESGANSPLTKQELIEMNWMYSTSNTKYVRRRDGASGLKAGDVVLLEVVAGETRDVYAYYNPTGGYACIVNGGTISGDLEGTLAHKYINLGNIARLLIGDTSPIRLAIDCIYSRKVAATGYDCDLTTDMAAIDVLVQAHNGRPLELGLVADRVTAELSEFYRKLYGNVRICSHSDKHFSSSLGAYVDAVDETHVVPANRVIKMEHPYKVQNLVVTIGETTLSPTTFIGTVSDSQYGYDEARGFMKFSANNVGATVTLNYDYLKEPDEWIGSLRKLQELGVLTSDSIYLTAGEFGIHGTTQALCDNRGITLCNYDAPNRFSYVRAKQGFTPVFSPYLADDTSLGFNSFYKLVVVHGYSQTEVEAEDGYAKQAIDNANSRKHPFIWYDHDFPYANEARGIHQLADVDASWKGATYEETRQKLITGLKWFLDRLDEENVYWMARSEYHRRYKNFNDGFVYNVESNGNTHYVHLQNKGKNPIPGVTFRSSKSIVSAKLMPNVDLEVTTYAGDDLVSFDVAPGEKLTVEIVVSDT